MRWHFTVAAALERSNLTHLMCELPSARLPTLADIPTMTAHYPTRAQSRSDILHQELERGLPAAIVHGSNLAAAAADFESGAPGVV
jgi:hypothetical protein